MAGKQLSEASMTALEEVVAREGFIKPEFSVGGGTKPGDNYVGVIHRVKVEEKQNGSHKPALSLIVKSQPEKEARRAQFQTPSFFCNEAVFYNEILPAFLAFQKEKGVTTNLAPTHPRCLKADELLIMEDQSSLGFIMRDRRVPLDYAHCLLIMKELSRLHAVSFALKDQRPTLFKQITGSLKETLFVPHMPSGVSTFFNNSGVKALSKYEEHSRHPSKRKYLEAMKWIGSEMNQSVIDLLEATKDDPQAVINHGDCWTTNILFKYTQDNKHPEAACLLDFQLARIASPACDISYFIYCCTDKATRSAHYHQLLQQYHSSLATHLARLGSDVDRLFPMEALQDQMKRFGRYGVAMSMATIPMFTCNPEDIPDLDEACEGDDFASKFSFERSDDKPCWERLCDVIEDAVDLGYVE